MPGKDFFEHFVYEWMVELTDKDEELCKRKPLPSGISPGRIGERIRWRNQSFCEYQQFYNLSELLMQLLFDKLNEHLFIVSVSYFKLNGNNPEWTEYGSTFQKWRQEKDVRYFMSYPNSYNEQRQKIRESKKDLVKNNNAQHIPRWSHTLLPFC